MLAPRIAKYYLVFQRTGLELGCLSSSVFSVSKGLSFVYNMNAMCMGHLSWEDLQGRRQVKTPALDPALPLPRDAARSRALHFLYCGTSVVFNNLHSSYSSC